MAESIGKFDVLGNLGHGAGSTILKIRRHEDGKVYALKIIKVQSSEENKYIEQVEREFEIAQRLDHPGLLKSYIFEKQRWIIWCKSAHLLLEYVDGKPLADSMNHPVLRLAAIFYRTADALDHMHQRGYFHADIKPDNIMVTANAEVKVIDFGLAWKRGESKDRVQGTLEYLAPEQAKDKIVNAKTDIFNLGATMYRVLTKRPIPGEIRQLANPAMDRLVRPIAETNPQCPVELDQLVRSCVATRTSDRPNSMQAVRDSLAKVVKLLKASKSSDIAAK